MNFNDPIGSRKGIGEKTKTLLEKTGVFTVGDILLYFPRTYVEYPALSLVSEIKSAGTYGVLITPHRSPVTKSGRRMPVTLLNENIDGVNFSAIWFRSPYISKTIKANLPVVLFGKAYVDGDCVRMEMPKIFSVEEYKAKRSSLQPVYSLVAGLTNNLIAKTLKGIFDDIDENFDFPVSPGSERSHGEILSAFKEMHFPGSIESLSKARSLFVYDEFFWFILQMKFGKAKTYADNGLVMKKPCVSDYFKKLPYTLTGAQLRTLDMILKSVRGECLSQRLIQGDVGSGKTAVAYFSMLDMHLNGYSSAIMAPTEVLANQHYETFCSMNEMLGVDAKVILLTGSMTAAEKKNAKKLIKETPGAMIIGTHAIFQEGVCYNSLGLAITDEQHRFGVNQRRALAEKGDSVHILVMSATPIPRTLAMILYGDMDISVIDELPPGRKPIKNAVIGEDERMKAYGFIKKQVEKGHQAYVICPFVEESESISGENVEDYTGKLREIFDSSIKIEALHGRMKPAEKNEIMDRFAKNETQILVSTTVIEVGVNVPNATVMMIENANRFGLAALHQLRGRVGRGADESYCIMIGDLSDANAKKRLMTLQKSNDGFFIASEDLKLRGPGDFLGIRQSGDMSFKIADIYQDAEVLTKAAGDVDRLLAMDEELTEHPALKERLFELKKRQALML